VELILHTFWQLFGTIASSLKMINRVARCTCLLVLGCIAAANGAGMLVESFDGPVTEKEIQSFVDFVQPLTPDMQQASTGREWAQGKTGDALKGFSLVYDISPRKEILDKMVEYCDVLLSSRNDILPAPAGHQVIWTGRVDPVWPNRPDVKPIQTAGEQGDPIGHLGACAKQILKTPKVHHQAVKSGDKHGFGKTYLERAKRYMKEADKVFDQHVLRSQLNLTDGDRMYWAKNSPYQTGQSVPWNQQMMFDYGFVNLAQAHEILNDDNARVARYDKIVKANVDWFFNQVKKYTDKKGNPAYVWFYTMSAKDLEDNIHGSMDVAGLVRLYDSGRYNISANQMSPITIRSWTS